MSNKIQEAFDSIHAEPRLKSETSAYLSRKLYHPVKKVAPIRRFAAVSICFVLLLIGGGYYTYFTPVLAISIDVNPSIELSINRFDRVVSVEGYNEDGKELVPLLSVNYLPYQQAIAAILAEEQIQSYLDDGELLSMTVAGDSQKQNEKMLTTLSQYTTQENISCHAADAQEVANAHGHGISVGKYNAYLTLNELDSSITVEEVKHLTMRQIMDRIGELSGDERQWQVDENQPQGDGCGNGPGGGSGGKHGENDTHDGGHGGNGYRGGRN